MTRSIGLTGSTDGDPAADRRESEHLAAATITRLRLSDLDMHGLALLIATIFPVGGEVPPTPTIWISADQVPPISVRTKDGPVVFDVDEMKLEHGIHRIAIYPQLDIGATFTVTAGKSHAVFTVVDGARHGTAADQPDVDAEFKHLSVVRRGAADILVIDSVVRRGTIMYLLDQRHFDGLNDPGYLWVGEGTSPARAPSYDPAGSLERTQFEIPLAELGVSCASQATVDFSPYTQGLQGGATLYPIATFVVDRGRIRLPMTILGDSDHATDALPWLPCPGASADPPPPKPEPPPSTEPPPSSAPPPAEQPPAGPPTTIAIHELQVEPAPHDRGFRWLEVTVILFGALLVMWRATSRIGA